MFTQSVLICNFKSPRDQDYCYLLHCTQVSDGHRPRQEVQDKDQDQDSENTLSRRLEKKDNNQDDKKASR